MKSYVRRAQWNARAGHVRGISSANSSLSSWLETQEKCGCPVPSRPVPSDLRFWHAKQKRDAHKNSTVIRTTTIGWKSDWQSGVAPSVQLISRSKLQREIQPLSGIFAAWPIQIKAQLKPNLLVTLLTDWLNLAASCINRAARLIVLQLTEMLNKSRPISVRCLLGTWSRNARRRDVTAASHRRHLAHLT